MRAVVDIGSNSIKYLVGEVQRGVPVVQQGRSWVTRLGKGLEKTGVLDPESVALTVEALRSMQQELTKIPNLQPAQVVATSAVRDCKNPEAIQSAVQEIFGVPLRILTGLEEAQYSAEGALTAGHIHYGTRRCCTIDVGGASTEVGIAEPEFRAVSFQAGAVRCHERLGLQQIPVDDTLWAQAQRGMEEFFPLTVWKDLQMHIPSGTPAVAVGGSLLAAARLAGASPTHTAQGASLGYSISVAQLEAFNDRFRKLSLEERSKHPGLDKGRADILCAGVLCLLIPLKRLGLKEVFITEWGLRHGLLLSSKSNK